LFEILRTTFSGTAKAVELVAVHDILAVPKYDVDSPKMPVVLQGY
jgi:hypothetical protein